jgi:hypothetical protein
MHNGQGKSAPLIQQIGGDILGPSFYRANLCCSLGCNDWSRFILIVFIGIPSFVLHFRDLSRAAGSSRPDAHVWLQHCILLSVSLRSACVLTLPSQISDGNLLLGIPTLFLGRTRLQLIFSGGLWSLFERLPRIIRAFGYLDAFAYVCCTRIMTSGVVGSSKVPLSRCHVSFSCLCYVFHWARETFRNEASGHVFRILFRTFLFSLPGKSQLPLGLNKKECDWILKCHFRESIGCPNASVASANLSSKINFDLWCLLNTSDARFIGADTFLQLAHSVEKNCIQSLPRNLPQNDSNLEKKLGQTHGVRSYQLSFDVAEKKEVQ